LIKNGRIQLFRLNQRNGSTKLTIKLIYPTGIVLDGDQYLFIVDANNDRIIGSDENGFRCIFGCFGGDSTNDKLSAPVGMSFDSYGNIYVTDQRNLIVSMKIVRFSRNQRPKSHFLLLTNHCFA